MFQRFNENKDLLIVAVASFFIGFGAASFFGGGVDNTPKETPQKPEVQNLTLPSLPFDKETAGKKEQQPTAVPASSSFMMENQRAGSSVTIKKVEFSEAQWVVVRDRNNDGAAGSILGAGWFPAGIHENVSVPLLRDTAGGEEYLAMLYADTNSDKKFDHKTDALVKDAAGNAVSVSFNTVASPSSL